MIVYLMAFKYTKFKDYLAERDFQYFTYAFI